MQRLYALAATAGLLWLLFIAPTLVYSLPEGVIIVPSQVCPPTVIYQAEQSPVAAADAATTIPTFVASGPTTIICRADPRFHGALQASMYVLAILLVILTTVVSALTMGVMSVDDLRLQIWVHTGTQLQR